MNDKFDNFLGKYFDRTFYLPQLGRDRLWNYVSEIITQGVGKIELDDRNTHRITVEITENRDFIRSKSLQFLRTIRELKKFEKNFESKIKLTRSDIFFPDVITLSLLQSGDSISYDLIRSNRDTLSLPFLVDEMRLWAFDLEFMKTQQEAIRQVVKGKTEDPVLKEIFYFLFPAIPILLDVQLEWANLEATKKNLRQAIFDAWQKQRFWHPFFIQRFFQEISPESAVIQVMSQEYRSKILDAASEEKPDYGDVANLIVGLLPKDQRDFNLRQLALDWVMGAIETSEKRLSRNLLVAISIAAKQLSGEPDYFGFSEKKRASMSAWRYLSRNRDDTKILQELIEIDNSDAFAGTVVLYSLDDEQVPFGLKIPLDLQKGVISSFYRRLQKKILPRTSIFSDPKLSDYPEDIIWRWDQVEHAAERLKVEEQFPIKLADYLKEILRNDVNAFNKLIPNFFDFGLPTARARLAVNELAKFISVDIVMEAYEVQKAAGNIQKLNPRIVDALEDYKKSQEHDEDDQQEVGQ